MLQFPLGLLRLFSLLDGISFVVLLYFSIYEKRMLGNEEAIEIPGAVHGAIFTVFFILLIICSVTRKLPLKRVAQVFVCALIPFAPFFLEPSLRREQNNQ